MLNAVQNGFLPPMSISPCSAGIIIVVLTIYNPCMQCYVQTVQTDTVQN